MIGPVPEMPFRVNTSVGDVRHVGFIPDSEVALCRGERRRANGLNRSRTFGAAAGDHARSLLPCCGCSEPSIRSGRSPLVQWEDSHGSR